MRVLLSVEALDALKRENRILIILIGGDTCMPCKALRAKIDSYSKERNIPSIYVPIECFKEYLASLGILSIPTVLVYADGRLQIKEGGYFSLDMILNSVDRIKRIMDEA